MKLRSALQNHRQSWFLLEELCTSKDGRDLNFDVLIAISGGEGTGCLNVLRVPAKVKLGLKVRAHLYEGTRFF